MSLVQIRYFAVRSPGRLLLALLVGVIAARLLGRLFGRHVLPRLGLNEGAINAIQSISFYSLCVLFSLLSLELVNLPFAAFTFLGGAVAIAFGFGSQNILNNFMSGLILLAEQPIRVGDLVEMEGVRGVVEHIGARSTRVKTISNHEIIVPNSILLENKVTNLTLSGSALEAFAPADGVHSKIRANSRVFSTCRSIQPAHDAPIFDAGATTAHSTPSSRSLARIAAPGSSSQTIHFAGCSLSRSRISERA